jgi:hypothetical protein
MVPIRGRRPLIGRVAEPSDADPGVSIDSATNPTHPGRWTPPGFHLPFLFLFGIRGAGTLACPDARRTCSSRYKSEHRRCLSFSLWRDVDAEFRCHPPSTSTVGATEVSPARRLSAGWELNAETSERRRRVTTAPITIFSSPDHFGGYNAPVPERPGHVVPTMPSARAKGGTDGPANFHAQIG